jgi:tyrosine-protein phosphatase YwqE
MFSWLKSKPLSPPIPWGLKVDIHNHVLPGIDDGAKNMDQTIGLLQGIQSLGFDEVIATPHIAAGIYLNTRETISSAYGAVQYASCRKEQSLRGFAAEYMLDDYFDRQISTGLLCLPNPAEKKYVLVEFPYMDLPYHWHDSIFDLRRAGYTPILAHPERYNYIKPSIMLERIKGAGLMFQLNLLSLSPYYGKTVMNLAHFYLKEGLYDFAATDIHHEYHLAGLKKMSLDPVISEQIANYSFKNNLIFSIQK